NLKVADLSVWYKKWYAPNNATLVVVGDVDPVEVYNLARRYYGRLSRSNNIKPLKPRIEPEQQGMRYVTVEAPAKLPYLLMGYKVPVLKTAKQDWEPYALEVLAGVLDSGASARFSKRLVRDKQLAAGMSVNYNLYAMHNELFVIGGTPTAKTSVKQLQQAINAELDALKQKPVTAKELDRIKAQVVAGKVYEKDSIFYQAMQMGTLETVGLGWQRMDEYEDKVKAVTAEQVMQVAKKYLIDKSLTIAELKPQSLQQTNKR
ncbi:MAG: insulinase family protein, partial [Gammaproteobacteria bacterium]|nr:insulinase family protein [Gammaproteobacteria bacterium]